jgi:hypothetical protein
MRITPRPSSPLSALCHHRLPLLILLLLIHHFLHPRLHPSIHLLRRPLQVLRFYVSNPIALFLSIIFPIPHLKIDPNNMDIVNM